MKKFFHKNIASMCASASDVSFAAVVCLIMMGAISLVSIILLIGVILLVVSLIISLLGATGRKSTMVANT